MLNSDTKSLNEPLMVILLSYSPTWSHNDHLMKLLISDIDIHDDILNVSVGSDENHMNMQRGSVGLLWNF